MIYIHDDDEIYKKKCEQDTKILSKYYSKYPTLLDVENSIDVSDLDLETFTTKLNRYIQNVQIDKVRLQLHLLTEGQQEVAGTCPNVASRHPILEETTYSTDPLDPNRDDSDDDLRCNLLDSIESSRMSQEVDDFDDDSHYHSYVYTTIKQWEVILLYIKRYLQSRCALMDQQPVTLEEYITMINDYASNICKDPYTYWEYFSGNTTENSKIITEIKKIEECVSILNTMGEIYGVIKLYNILRTMMCEMLWKWPQLIRYSKSNSKIKYGDILAALSKEEADDPEQLHNAVTRQLFSLAKSVNEIYNGCHVFTVYAHSPNGMFTGSFTEVTVECVRKLVDTNNNLYKPLVYELTKDQIDEINNNNIANGWSVREDSNGFRCDDFDGDVYDPGFHILHNANGTYIFRMDEYMGDDLHQTIKIDIILPSSTGNCHYKEGNQIYQYLDLYWKSEKDRLYGYIYDNPELSNLAIHYLIVDIHNDDLRYNSLDPNDPMIFEVKDHGFEYPDGSFQGHRRRRVKSTDVCTLTTHEPHYYCGGECLRRYPHLKRPESLPEISINEKESYYHIFHMDFIDRPKKRLPFDSTSLYHSNFWTFKYGVNEECQTIPGYLYPPSIE